MKEQKIYSKQGFSLVEVVVSAAIMLVCVLALLTIHNLYLKNALDNTYSAKAAYLAEEGLEAMRYLRDDSWSGNISSLSDNFPYGVSLVGGVWKTGSTTAVDVFDRTITLGPVYRDVSGDIVSAGGSLASTTRLVTSSVSWSNRGATSTITLSTYLTNLNGF